MHTKIHSLPQWESWDRTASLFLLARFFLSQRLYKPIRSPFSSPNFSLASTNPENTVPQHAAFSFSAPLDHGIGSSKVPPLHPASARPNNSPLSTTVLPNFPSYTETCKAANSTLQGPSTVPCICRLQQRIYSSAGYPYTRPNRPDPIVWFGGGGRPEVYFKFWLTCNLCSIQYPEKVGSFPCWLPCGVAAGKEIRLLD